MVVNEPKQQSNCSSTTRTISASNASLDYFPGPWGAGWRCDRQAWKNYGTKTIGGAPGGDWYHIEIAPRFADKPAEYIKRFERLKGTPQV
jgi:hypothetical protein